MVYTCTHPGGTVCPSSILMDGRIVFFGGRQVSLVCPKLLFLKMNVTCILVFAVFVQTFKTPVLVEVGLGVFQKIPKLESRNQYMPI